MNNIDKVRLIKEIIQYSGEKLLILKESPIMGITGPVMMPNKQIYRNDKLGEYYIIFDEAAIVNLRNNYHKNKFCNNTNINHSNNKLESITMYDSYIIDEYNRNNLPNQFKDLPNGTWMITYSISNKSEYEYIIENELTGFSIELNLSKKQEEEIMKMNFNKQPKNESEESSIENINSISDNFINILIPILSTLSINNYKLMFIPILISVFSILTGYIMGIFNVKYNSKLYYLIYLLNIVNMLVFIILILFYSIKISII